MEISGKKCKATVPTRFANSENPQEEHRCKYEATCGKYCYHHAFSIDKSIFKRSDLKTLLKVEATFRAYEEDLRTPGQAMGRILHEIKLLRRKIAR